MKKRRIYEELIKLKESDFYPFHMPGHKRNKALAEKMGLWEDGLNPYELDITEIPYFDDKHEAEGIIKEAEEMAAKLYGAKSSVFSVNGSTGAILSAIGGVVERGDFVLVARNCHKSVYHALELFELSPIYLQGEIGKFGIYQEIKAIEVEEKLRRSKNVGKKISLVILTSPTYEGVVSDIEKIAEICHFYGVFLMVDEAHGSHFGLSEGDFFPETAVGLGADIVIQSLHKTLPSFTQTALLHINDTTIVEKVRRQVGILETSSPSYLMMMGMEACLNVVKQGGKELFSEYEKRLAYFYKKAKELKRVSVWDEKENRDRGKIVITAGIGSGSFLYEYFYEECHLIMEMKSKDYVLAMTSIFDREEGFDRLLKSLFLLDERLRKLDNRMKIDYTFEETIEKKIGRVFKLPDMEMTPAETRKWLGRHGKERLDRIEEAEGRISADFIYFYPPGIPLVVSGERIEKDVIKLIKEGRSAGIKVYGGSDGDGIFVCADGEEFVRQGQYLS